MVPVLALFGFVAELFTASQADVQERHQRYLSESVDMCDLETRMRELDGARPSLGGGDVPGIFAG